MNKLLIFPLFLGGILFSQQKTDSLEFRKIADVVMNDGTAYEDLRHLTKNIGHRVSGSEAYEKAADWAVETLKKAGADKVWKQPVNVPVWMHGKESLAVKGTDGKWKKIRMLSLGNSEGTGGKDLSGALIVVRNFDEFNKLADTDLKDKIVLFNYPFRQEIISTMEGYGDAVKYRVMAASAVARRGGKAAIIRSVSTAFDDVPHTGVMHYQEGVRKIPVGAVGPRTADELQEMAARGVLVARLNSNCGMRGEKPSFNVIGELTGKDSKKVIVVGGHLDSWDVGEGAHDDGTGIVQSIEVLRALKKTAYRNHHTIRVVCFANEENGARGGNAYADSLQLKKEPHIFALESDAGGFSPRGFGLIGTAEQKKQIRSWAPLFLPYGVYDFSIEEGGVDIDPMKKSGIALSGLIPDSQRYFDIHHSDADTFEKVNRRELLLGATVMTQMIYMIDRYWK